MLDQISSADMTEGASTSYTTDRFGNINSALALNGGWTQIPGGVYFDTPSFTISLWVYPVSAGASARIIDFGSGPGLTGGVDNVAFSLGYSGTLQEPYVYLNGLNYVATTTLTQNAWQHLAAAYDGNTLTIYNNGVSVMTSSVSYSLPRVTRTNCYIGKSNWAADGYSWSYFDELRFYNLSLSQAEILLLMNQNGSCKILI